MLAELKFYDVDFSTYHGNPNEFLLLSINGGIAMYCTHMDEMIEHSQGTRYCDTIIVPMSARIAVFVYKCWLDLRFVHDTVELLTFCWLGWINMFIKMK